MSSGTSTPRTASTTPTPPSDVSPLTVGTQFVKKYYQVLSTAPEEIDRFYKASTSTVTRGHGSDPAAILVTDFTDGAAAARFANHVDQVIRFEFEHGAIDAQFSVNSGIVLVVTGQVVYVPSEIRKSFVHTFFLGSTVAGVKRSYYVHNDILRFLEMEETNGVRASETTAITGGAGEAEAVHIATQTEEEAAVESAPVNPETAVPPLPVEELTSSVVEVPSMTKDLAQLEEKVATVTTIPIETSKIPMDVAPGRGVEESKEAILDEADMSTAGPSSKAASAPATPGSWASLVARTAPGSTPPATPLRPEKTTTPVHAGGASALPSHPSSAAAVKKATDASAPPAPASASTTAPATATASTEPNNNHHANNRAQPPFRPRREAECTLIIKNIDDSVTEDEIQALFEPFAADTTAGYVGCTVQGHRGIAFVDYDTPEPVVKAVQHQTESGPFMIRELKLDVYQKIFVDKSQPHQRGMGGRGSYRGGGGRYSSGGGGREYYNPSSGRGGEGGRAAGRSFRRGGGRDGRAGGRSSQPGDTAGGDSGGGP